MSAMLIILNLKVNRVLSYVLFVFCAIVKFLEVFEQNFIS